MFQGGFFFSQAKTGLSHQTLVKRGKETEMFSLMAIMKVDNDVGMLAMMLAVTWFAAWFGGRVAKDYLHIPQMVGQFLGGVLLGPTVFGRFSPQGYGWLFANEQKATYQHVISLAVLVFLLWLANEGHPDQFREKPKKPLTLGLVSFAISAILGVVGFQIYALYYPEVDKLAWPIKILLMVGPMMSSPVIVSQIYREQGRTGELVVDSLFAALVSEFTGIIVLSSLMYVNGNSWYVHFAKTFAIVLFLVFSIRFGPEIFNKILFRNKKVQDGELVIRVKMIGLLAAGFAAVVLGVKTSFSVYLVGVLSGSIEPLRRKVVHFVQDLTNNLVGPLFFASLGISIDFREAFSLELILFFMVVPPVLNFSAAVIATYVAGVHRRDRMAMALGLTPTAVVFVVLLRAMNLEGLLPQEVLASSMFGVFAGTIVVNPLIARATTISAKLVKGTLKIIRQMTPVEILKDYTGAPELVDAAAALLQSASPLDSSSDENGFTGSVNKVATAATKNIPLLGREIARFGVAVLFARDSSVKGLFPLVLMGASAKPILHERNQPHAYDTHFLVLLIFPAGSSELFVSWLTDFVWDATLLPWNLVFRTTLSKKIGEVLSCPLDLAKKFHILRPKKKKDAEGVEAQPST